MASQTKKIGFMQGRLSDIVDGKIQAFPWNNWKNEFCDAKQINIKNIEWTLDQKDLYKNPLMSNKGRSDIKNLCNKFSVKIPSLTGDCFMQAPFWKANKRLETIHKRDFIEILKSCSDLDISIVVLPLVDAGSIDSEKQEAILIKFLDGITNYLQINNMKIVFESEYKPQEFKRFLDNLDEKVFGVNYDIGNSASLGFDPIEEFSLYGDRIFNVHVKDRIYRGTTVPLGAGSANFELVFSLLKSINYNGNYILQTARASDGEHIKMIEKYKHMLLEWIEK